MNRFAPALILAVAPLLISAVGAAPADEPTSYPAETYTAVIQRQTGTTGAGSEEIQVSIAILRPMTVEEALPLRDALKSGGQQAMVRAIQGRAQGMLRLGGLEYPLDLVVEQQQGDTLHIAVVTTRRIDVNETNTGAASLDYPFGLAVFDVDSLGRGEGTVYPKATLEVLSDGGVGVSTFEDRTYSMIRMKREK
jgi:hypothetical protein